MRTVQAVAQDHQDCKYKEEVEVEMVEGVGVVVMVEGLVEAVGLPILWCTRLGNQGQVCVRAVFFAFLHLCTEHRLFVC